MGKKKVSPIESKKVIFYKDSLILFKSENCIENRTINFELYVLYY
jgi:hypothetical protein